MDTHILIFLSSLGIIWAENSTTVVRSFDEEPVTLPFDTKQDIEDQFNRTESVPVPKFKIDVSIPSSQYYAIKENIKDLFTRTKPNYMPYYQTNFIEPFSQFSEIKEDIDDVFHKEFFSRNSPSTDKSPIEAEPPALNPKIRKDIADLFKRSGPDSLPHNRAGNLEYSNPSSVKENIYEDNGYYDAQYYHPNAVPYPNYKPSIDVLSKFHGPYDNFFQCDRIGYWHMSTTLAECADLCDRESRCTVFNYGTKSQYCELGDCGSPTPSPTGEHEEYKSYSKKKLQRHMLPSLVLSIPKNVTFSLFRKEHKQALLSLITHFKAVYDLQPNITTMIQYVKEVKPYINVFLHQDAASNFFHKKGLGECVPPISERFPEDFVNLQGLQKIKEESKNLIAGRKKRQLVRQDSVTYRRVNGGMIINQRLDLSGTDHVPEHRVAYFREDYGMNSHHHHWHSDMPDNTRVTRRMEYFMYMHAQMLRRYNTERLSVGLPTVQEYSNFFWPIEVGHLSNLGYTRKDYGIREDNMRPSDYVRNNVHAQNQIKRRLDNQIRFQDLDYGQFTSNLEDYHDEGHANIARTVINGRNNRAPLNVMELPTTSARDNVFYRWHQHIDDLYENYMAMTSRVNRRSLTIREMTFDDIELKSLRIESNKLNNKLFTGCGYHRLDITNGLNFIADGRYIIEMIHLDHVPFSYHIQYNNKASGWKSGVVRIFLAPTNDERGNRMAIEKQRRFWIEMDKFKYNFQPGNNVLERKSSESTVTVDCRKVFVGCKFPFIFNKVSYSKCVNPDNSERPWCSTKTDDKNNHVKDNWKYCDGDCQFPFYFNGRRYDHCAQGEGISWCSTKTDARNNYIGGHWKFCNDDPYDRDGHCRCGWPQHLLVPRGSRNGMKFKLFVIVTNERNIREWDVADNIHSTYCGFEGQDLSDQREMGFPFHAPAPRQIRSIQDFPSHLSNSAVADISIHFHGNATNPTEEPVSGCGR